jgi:succinoglycan biosynthesis protein ExoM
MNTLEHIVVCVCTFKRPQSLRRLLRGLEHQHTDGEFTFSVLIVDNDRHSTAQDVCNHFQASSSLTVEYYIEPEQNIALARNMAIRNAKGDFVALIDDDEYPLDTWLLTLYRACHTFDCDGILGPVLPSYETNTPAWVIKGRFYERPLHQTGTLLHWSNTRTGNAMLRKHIFEANLSPFRPEFGMGGEDRDFFRRMIERGRRFVWCAEAPVYEAIPPERCKRSFMLRRALLRGTIPQFSFVDALKSLIAVPLYSVVLPLLFFCGHHRFMKCLIADFDHIGRVLWFCGISVIKQKYVLE